MKHESHKVPDYLNQDKLQVRVGLCQVETAPFACIQNRTNTLQSLREAGKIGCDIAITPECVIHGYGFSENRETLFDQVMAAAETQEGETVSAAKEIAVNYNMAVAIGYAEKEDGKLYNATSLINPEGEICAHYRKVHLRDFEARSFGSVFDPGDSFPVVSLRLKCGVVRTGIMICFDREIPESVRSLRTQDVELILCPLACDTEPLDAPQNFAENEMVTRIRAAENEVYIAVVNHASRFNGGTFVVGPAGECLYQAGSKPEVTLVNLPIGGLRDTLRNNPYTWMGWGYRRPEVYKKYPI